MYRLVTEGENCHRTREGYKIVEYEREIIPYKNPKAFCSSKSDNQGAVRHEPANNSQTQKKRDPHLLMNGKNILVLLNTLLGPFSFLARM